MFFEPLGVQTIVNTWLGKAYNDSVTVGIYAYETNRGNPKS
jgi:hypothetical protein